MAVGESTSHSKVMMPVRPSSLSGDRAAASAFAGSPTILVDGVDAFDDAVQLTELACRVYSTDRGLAGLPTVDQLAASLQSKGEALQR